jgi:hypothetical protein
MMAIIHSTIKFSFTPTLRLFLVLGD